jgi:hypothetical protein
MRQQQVKAGVKHEQLPPHNVVCDVAEIIPAESGQWSLIPRSRRIFAARRVCPGS